eukprot:scaffold1569_cov79-Isochrysis_galbana.AAC.4
MGQGSVCARWRRGTGSAQVRSLGDGLASSSVDTRVLGIDGWQKVYVPMTLGLLALFCGRVSRGCDLLRAGWMLGSRQPACAPVRDI